MLPGNSANGRIPAKYGGKDGMKKASDLFTKKGKRVVVRDGDAVEILHVRNGVIYTLLDGTSQEFKGEHYVILGSSLGKSSNMKHLSGISEEDLHSHFFEFPDGRWYPVYEAEIVVLAGEQPPNILTLSVQADWAGLGEMVRDCDCQGDILMHRKGFEGIVLMPKDELVMHDAPEPEDEPSP